MIMTTKRISFLAQTWFDKKSNTFTAYVVHISAYQIFYKTHHTQLHWKRNTDTYTERCENMWLILRRNRKCQCHIWTSCWWRFAHFDLAPDSTITNTPSSVNLDVTDHPLFLIVNWTSQYHGLFFIKFSKVQWNLHQMAKNLEFLNLIFWFLKTYGWRQPFKS